jgi:hypothetical protein
MLTIAPSFCDNDNAFSDDDEELGAPKRTMVDEVVALGQRVILGIVVRAPRVVATRLPPSQPGGAEVHELLVRGFIELRSHTELLAATRGAPRRAESAERQGRHLLCA